VSSAVEAISAVGDFGAEVASSGPSSTFFDRAIGSDRGMVMSELFVFSIGAGRAVWWRDHAVLRGVSRARNGSASKREYIAVEGSHYEP
jgi:hypothetical protein